MNYRIMLTTRLHVDNNQIQMQATQQIKHNANARSDERVNVAVRLPREVAKQLRVYVANNETSMQDVVEQAVMNIVGGKHAQARQK